MKYKGCELSHMENIKAVSGRDYDQGWSMVFQERKDGKLIRSIACSVESDRLERHSEWLRQRNEDLS